MKVVMLNFIKYNFVRKFFRYMEKYDITLEELKQKQLDGAEVIDVRNKREYEEGHIEGSINIPEYEINEDFKNIIINKNKYNVRTIEELTNYTTHKKNTLKNKLASDNIIEVKDAIYESLFSISSAKAFGLINFYQIKL